MKNSNDYINEKVFKTNKKYAKLQNLTEELFFQCLDEGRSVEYFYKKLEEIWGNIDHSFIQQDIQEYANLIETNNYYLLEQEQAPKGTKTTSNLLFAIGIGVYVLSEEKFMNIIKKRYEMYYNSPEYKRNKEEYLKRKVKNYDNQVIPYYDKDGNIIRWVQLSTYLSMRYNTELTKAGWNKTIEDALELGYDEFWIPPHLFSCEHCIKYQGKILSYSEVMEFTQAEEHENDILHPNCKCELLIYTPNTHLIYQNLSTGEADEYYNIRQKVNSLTLKKERILTDMKIQKRLGNQDEVDTLNSQRKKINTQIRELINSLPTDEMKKKVVAINR